MGCTSKEIIKNDLIKENLKGKVKSIRQTPYEAVEKFGEITKGNVFHEFYISINSIIEFNEEGNVIMEGYYLPNGNFHRNYKKDNRGNKIEENRYNSNGELHDKQVYVYDERDILIEENRYNSNGELLDKQVYVYDERDILIEDNIYRSDGKLSFKTIYKSDHKNNIVEEDLYNSKGKLKSKTINKYDINGNKIEEVISDYEEMKLVNGKIKMVYDYNKPKDITKYLYRYDKNRNMKEMILSKENDEDYGFKSSYKFDENNYMIEEATYSLKDKLKYKFTYKRDKRGNVIEENSYDSNNELQWTSISKYDKYGNEEVRQHKAIKEVDNYKGEPEPVGTTNTKYKYKYDEKGNWIEKIEYVNYIPKKIIEREIEYY